MPVIPALAHIPNQQNFLEQCHLRQYPARAAIIHAGDASDSLFFIVKGSVSVVIEDDEGREMVVAYLNAGDFFGEMGLFEDKPIRSAWICAKSACEVAEISYRKFKELARQDAGLIFQRFQHTTDHLARATDDPSDFLAGDAYLHAIGVRQGIGLLGQVKQAARHPASDIQECQVTDLACRDAETARQLGGQGEDQAGILTCQFL